MKRASALFAAAAATLLLSGAAVAKDQTGTSTAPTTSTTPAEKPGMLAMPHHVTGTVMSVDKNANSFVVKDTKAKEMTLVADNDTAADLSRLKTGDEVKVTYKKSRDQLVATKINTTVAKAPRTTK